MEAETTRELIAERSQSKAAVPPSTLQLGLEGRWLGRWKIPRLNCVSETYLLVGAIAKRLVGGMAATAERNRRAARQAEWLAGRIVDLKIALDSQRAIVKGSDLCGHHSGWYHVENGTLLRAPANVKSLAEHSR
jgi:hypothetical protein